MFEKLFGIRKAGSTVRTEIMAGLTTFMTMGYIILSILESWLTPVCRLMQ